MRSPGFRARAEAEFRALGLHGALDFTLSADMRFVGQAFEIAVELDPTQLPTLTAGDLAERFAAAHRRVYLHGGEPGRRVEIVGLRFGIRRRLDALPEFAERPIALARSADAPVRIGAGTVTARLLTLRRCGASDTIAGPALIEGYSSTIWVPPGWHATRDAGGNILLRRSIGMTLDPVDYAIISQALIAAAREMGAKLVRSAFSTVLREARDGSAALLDAQRQHGGAGRADPDAARHDRAHLPALRCALSGGDAGRKATSSPSTIRIPAASICRTCSCSTRSSSTGRLIGFSASVAHHLDLGGGSPGLNPAATDVWAEGLIIPPLKLNMARDWHGGMFERLLRANVRVPHQTMGDFDAQMAANAIGMARMQELADALRRGQGRGGDGGAAGLFRERACAPRSARCRTASITARMRSTTTAIRDAPLPVRATVTVRGDSVAVDFAGTRRRCGRHLNAPFASTMSAALVVREGGADQPGHSVQRRCGAAGDDHRAARARC